ncbi:hypothetical protein [Acidovorax sp.]|uniref:hypothetical protein n=1 Tax=Acidovorax sp. TaxID=1872122 RepID=UPI0025B95DEF|nr:hypothetical protein [Acidovorax sp.]MBW8464848.1 hypothetical protein [Acidovorax sp.]
MSSIEQSFPAAHIARELGIQLAAEDVPNLVAALHRAYATGLRDGAAKEREACATLIQLGPQPVTGFGSKVEIGFGARTAYAAAIRARGQKEGA